MHLVSACAGLAALLIQGFCGSAGSTAHAVAVYDTLGPSNTFASYGVSVGMVLGDDWEAGIRFTPSQTVRFTGLDVALAQTLSGSGPGAAAVSLRLDANGAPGTAVETMLTPTVNALSGAVWNVGTGFGPTLAAGKTYWVTVGHAPGSTLGGTWRYAMQNITGGATVATRKNGTDWTVVGQPRPYAVRVSGDAVMPGDANQDGRISMDDFALFDRGQARHLAGWNNGDFNGDNLVDLQDHMILDAAYVAQRGGASPEFLASRTQEYGPEYVAGFMALVPEPGVVGLVGAGAVVLAGRRRRQVR